MIDDKQDGYSRFSSRAESYGERLAGRWADHPARQIFKVIVGLVIISLVFSVIGWLGGWFNEAKRVTGPANVSNQYASVIQDWQDLISSSQNSCQVQQQSKRDGDPLLVEDPALAYAATYRKIRSDFNRRQQNIFEAKAVGPSGYPRVVDPFPEESTTPINWCAISTKLVQIHS